MELWMAEQTSHRMCYSDENSIFQSEQAEICWLGHQAHQGLHQKMDFTEHLSSCQLIVLQIL